MWDIRLIRAFRAVSSDMAKETAARQAQHTLWAQAALDAETRLNRVFQETLLPLFNVLSRHGCSWRRKTIMGGMQESLNTSDGADNKKAYYHPTLLRLHLSIPRESWLSRPARLTVQVNEQLIVPGSQLVATMNLRGSGRIFPRHRLPEEAPEVLGLIIRTAAEANPPLFASIEQKMPRIVSSRP